MHGGGGGTNPGGTKRARIEIIPLIDVVFFLLATFVLFTLSLNRTGGVHVTIPTSETSEPRDPNNSVTISVTETGAIGWNKELVNLDDFLSRLTQQHLKNPETKILVNGDESAAMSQVTYVLDQVRRAEFRTVLIETRVAPPK